MARCINKNLQEFKNIAEVFKSPIVANIVITGWQDLNSTDQIPTIQQASEFAKNSETAYNLKRKDFAEAVYNNLSNKGIITKFKGRYFIVQSNNAVYDPGIRKFNLNRLKGYLRANNIPLNVVSTAVRGKAMEVKIHDDLFTPSDILPESRSYGTPHTRQVVAHLLKLFPQINVEFLSVKDAKKLHDKLPESQKANVNFDNVNSFFVNGTAVLIKGRVTDTTAIEEILHPFVDGFYTSKPEIFNSLYNEAVKNFPELNAGIQSAYSDRRGFSERHRQLELVTQALSRHFNNEYENNPTKSFKDRIKDFIDWFVSIIENLSSVFNGRNIDYFRGDQALLEQEQREDRLEQEDVVTVKRINVNSISGNPTLSDIAKLLNTSDIEFDVNAAPKVDTKVRYNLSEEKSRIYDYVIKRSNGIQQELIENFFLAARETNKLVDELSVGTIERDADGNLISPIIVLDEATHTYMDLTDPSKKITSTTQAIKGQMSREKQEENDLNLKLGNDFDKILEGLVTDVTSAELFDKMEILNEEQFGKAYASMQASLAGLMKDNTVAIPQVVVYDKATGIAGSIDLLLIEPDGKVRVVDLKTSKYSKNDPFYKTILKEVNAKDPNFGILPEDSVLKQKGIADSLSIEQTHNLQVNLYGRMLENMGYTLSEKPASTYHIKVDVTGKGKNQKFQGEFKPEGEELHKMSENVPYLDAIIPYNVDVVSKERIDEARKGKEDSTYDTTLPPDQQNPLDDAPTSPEFEVITQALRDYRKGLIKRQDALSMLKGNVFLGRHKTVEQLQESIQNSINVITVAMTQGPKTRSAVYASLMRDALRQVDEFQQYVEDPINFSKPEYISYVLNFDEFIKTFEGLYSLQNSKELNRTQVRLAFKLQTRFNELVGVGDKEGVIDKAVTDYVRDTVARRSSYNFTEDQLDNIMKLGKDIGVIDYQARDLATTATLLNDGTPDTLLSIMDKIYKAKKQELLDKIETREMLINKAAQKVLELSTEKDPQKLFEFMLEFDNEGLFTGRYVKEVGSKYYNIMKELRKPLYDDNGQPYQYRDVTDVNEADPADVEYNIRLAKAKQRYGDFWSAETIGPDGTPVHGKYHKYTDEFIAARKKHEYFVAVGRNGIWKRKPEISDAAWGKYTAKYKVSGLEQESRTFSVNDADGNPTGAIRKDELFPQVRKEFIEKIITEDLKSEKYKAIQADKSALGLARKEFYDLFVDLYENQLLTKLPKATRHQMLGKVPLIRGRWAQDLKGKGNVFTKMYAKTSRGVKNFFTTTQQQKVIQLDSDNNLVDQLPIFYTGNARSDEALAAIDDQIQALKDKRQNGDIKIEPYKKELALLEGQRKKIENKPSLGEVNKDMGNGLLKFAAMAEHYETMSTVEDTMQAFLRVLKKRSYESADNIKTDVKDALGKLTPVGTIKGEDSKTFQRAKKWMNMVYYDNDQLTQGFIDKAASGLIKFSSLSYVAFNPFGNFNNYVLGRVNDNIEAIGGRFYSAQAYKRASIEYNKRAIPDLIHRLASANPKDKLLNRGDYDPRLPSSKYEAFVEYYRMMDESTDIRESGSQVDRIQKSRFAKMMDWGYTLQDAAEWNVQTKVGMAMLMDTYIMNKKTGKILSLYDAHTFDAKDKRPKLIDGFTTIVKYNPKNVDENGKPKQIEEIGEYNDDFRYDLRNKIREVNKQIHGNYAEEDRMVLQSSTVGKLGAQFHKWVMPAARARFQREYFDENLGWMEGRYLSWFKFMAWSTKEMAKGNMKFNKYKDGFLEDYGYIEEGDVQENQRAMNKLFGFYRTMGEIGIIMLTVLLKDLLIAAFHGDDDDSDTVKRLKNIAMYQADRTYKELILFVPVPDGLQQMMQMVKSPIASTRTLGELGEALSLTYMTPLSWLTSSDDEFYANSDYVYQRGSRAGELKVFKNWQDALPAIYTYKKWINYLEMQNFFIK